MRLNIPKLKTELIVAQDVDVTIYCESRNMKFLQSQNLVQGNAYNWGMYICSSCKAEISFKCTNCNTYENEHAMRNFTLKKGVKLVIDRYYIRNGAEDFDSVTFRYHSGKTKGRFWLKLFDVECIDFEPLP
jgi:hypothetical protein